MSQHLSHAAALDCICGAAGVTVLSYEEAISAYFSLRGLTIPPDGPREGDGAAGVRATPNLSANERILP